MGSNNFRVYLLRSGKLTVKVVVRKIVKAKVIKDRPDEKKEQ
jgi:hypothetical protein